MTDHQKEKKESSGLQGVRVLVAEDAPDNQLLMRRFLETEGIIVDIAANGLEAIEKAKQGDHHLVFMDVMMPLCDGYESTRRLRAAGFSKPIIALTAHALSEDRERAFAEGCDFHLTKPIGRQLLISTVEQFVLKAQ